MYGNRIKTEHRHAYWHVPADRDGWVLALAGTRFLDRKEAIRQGYNPDRIIGVDLDPDVVAHNTKHGRPVLKGDLATIMGAWSDDRPVSVVVADFTANAGAACVTNTLFAWAHFEAFRNAYLIMTTSVGREIGEFREWVEMYASDDGKEMVDYHRGACAFQHFLVDSCFGNLEQPELEDKLVHAVDHMQLATLRYRAHKMNMDIIILAPEWPPGWNEKERVSGPEFLRDMHEQAYKDTANHIRAKLAWITIRNNK